MKLEMARRHHHDVRGHGDVFFIFVFGAMVFSSSFLKSSRSEKQVMMFEDSATCFESPTSFCSFDVRLSAIVVALPRL
jgi:hypothetical protein